MRGDLATRRVFNVFAMMHPNSIESYKNNPCHAPAVPDESMSNTVALEYGVLTMSAVIRRLLIVTEGR